MITSIAPKLPMRDKTVTRDFYVLQLGFSENLQIDYPEYLILHKEKIEIQFFIFKNLDPALNYGQVYIRVVEINELYQHFLKSGVQMHPNGTLATKPWGQREFSILDPDYNLLTFG